MAMVLPATADDWTAIKLRGAVFTLVNNSWVQLARGDVVPDDRIIRTAPNARVQFVRGKETIDLGPDTQIRIFDRDGQRFTVVQQHFGDVAIEAERLNVQHFVVQTRYLAAVVKGTRFSVSANASSAKVTVTRGQVEVRDVTRKVLTEVMPGQSASVGSAETLAVSGSGPRAPIVPYTGEPLAPAVAVTRSDSSSDMFARTASSTTGTTPAGATTTTAPTSTTVTTVAGTPAVSATADTPAASVVASTPAATNSPGSTSSTSATATSADTGTPAVSNTSDTPAASVVARTPAATKTMPPTSNAGGKK